MPYDDYPQYLRHILQCIINIHDFRAGMTLDQIRQDRKTESAIERELQIITEAAARLGPHADSLCPGIDWGAVRGFGNILRHAYDRLEPSMLQNIIDHELAELKPQIEAALARLQPLQGPNALP